MDNSTTSNTGDLTWGHLEDTEVYGRKTMSDDYIAVEKCVFKDHPGITQEASHCLIYAKTSTKVFNVYSTRAVILMQMRFDGYIGFPGGLVDPGEDDVFSLNRELNEELNLDLSKHKVAPKDYIISHYNKETGIGLHFYALEMTLEELIEVERRSLQAKDYGSEVLGTIRIPLYTMGDGYRGFPVFLQNQFIGNSREQLLYTINKLNIMSELEIERALKASQ